MENHVASAQANQAEPRSSTETLFPFIVEFESDQEFGGGVSHNSAERLSESGADNLFLLLAQSPRVRWACWYKLGERHYRNEYLRDFSAAHPNTTAAR